MHYKISVLLFQRYRCGVYSKLLTSWNNWWESLAFKPVLCICHFAKTALCCSVFKNYFRWFGSTVNLYTSNLNNSGNVYVLLCTSFSQINKKIYKLLWILSVFKCQALFMQDTFLLVFSVAFFNIQFPLFICKKVENKYLRRVNIIIVILWCFNRKSSVCLHNDYIESFFLIHILSNSSQIIKA